MRLVVGAQNPNEARPVVQPRAERPLVHDRRPAVVVAEHEPQRQEHALGHAGDIEDYKVYDGVDHELDHHAARVVVGARVDGHHDEDGQTPVGVHRADVVQDVLVEEDGAQDQHKEVETEQHLGDSQRRVVLLDPEEGEVTKASHPDVGRDVNSDPVVPLESMEEVIPQKHHLHPALPFFRLIPV